MKKFMYILLIIIVMFINTGNCYAKRYSEDFAFSVSDFSSPTVYEIMINLDESLGRTGATQPYWLYIEEFNGYQQRSYSQYNTNYKITKIAFNGKTAKEVYQTLKVYNLWEDISKSYCSAPKSNEATELCNKLKKARDNTTTSPSDKGKTCDYNFKDTELGATFSVYINEKITAAEVTSTSTNMTMTTGAEFARIDTTFLYFYEKGSSYSKFQEDYLTAYKNKTNINSNNCPILYLLKDKKNNWYTTLDKEKCENPPLDIYASGTCQTTSAGETQSYTYFDAPEFDSLIGEENIVKACKDIIKEGGDLQKILKSGVNIVRIFVPVALLVLGSLDIAQAIFAGDESKMKKSQDKFMKRLLIAIAIFLIPSVLKVILTIANGIWPIISSDLCGIL